MKKENIEWAESLLAQIENKTYRSVLRNRGRIPYTAIDGHFDDRSEAPLIDGWTNGFWPGIMWQMYVYSKKEIYLEEARSAEEKLRQCFSRRGALDHDAGFRWLPSSVVDYSLTGSERARDDALIAAGILLSRLNINGGFIRAWDDRNGIDNRGKAIIDTMMNLPLLHWASRETGDPRYSAVADLHARTARDAFIRPDGSAAHIVVFDPFTGSIRGTEGGQGLKEGSSWTRGQAWAVYGFYLQYLNTGIKDFYDIAEKVADTS